MYQEFDFFFFLPFLPWLSQTVKNLPVMQEILSQEDSLEMGIVPNPVVLLGESHGQRSLVGYSPWGHIELEHANLDIVIATQRQPYNLSYSAVYLAQISDLFDAIFKVNNF